MKAIEIRRMPTLSSELTSIDGKDELKLHESVFRSFHIVDKVVDLLKKDTPPEIILEMIEIMQSKVDNNLSDGVAQC